MRKIDVRLPMSAVIAAASHRVAARELLAPDQVAACSVTEQFSGTWKNRDARFAPKNGQKPKPSRWPAYTSSAHRKGETILHGWVIFSAAPSMHTKDRYSILRKRDMLSCQTADAIIGCKLGTAWIGLYRQRDVTAQLVVGDSKNTITLARSSADVSPP
jgi:hypothetical protein